MCPEFNFWEKEEEKKEAILLIVNTEIKLFGFVYNQTIHNLFFCLLCLKKKHPTKALSKQKQKPWLNKTNKNSVQTLTTPLVPPPPLFLPTSPILDKFYLFKNEMIAKLQRKEWRHQSGTSLLAKQTNIQVEIVFVC